MRAGIFAIDQWSKIGIETERRQLETKLFFDALARSDFDVAIDFITDHADDPNLQYVHVVSAAMQSPMSYSRHGDTKIDALFEPQKRALDPAERKQATREFEQYPISQAYSIMLFWWQRIVVYNRRVKRLAACAQPQSRQRPHPGVARSVGPLSWQPCFNMSPRSNRRARAQMPARFAGAKQADGLGHLESASTGLTDQRSRPSWPRSAGCP